MARPTTQEIIKNPRFLALPAAEKQKVLLKADERFSALSGQEQLKVVNSFEISQPQEASSEQVKKPFMPVLSEFRGLGKALGIETPQQAFQQIGRPSLEAGGAALGTLAGLPLAAPSLGTAPVAGGAIGFAGGKALADLLERLAGTKKPIKTLPEALKETAKGLQTGFEQEASGVLFPAAITKLTKLPSFILGGGKRLAGTVSKKGIEIADKLGVSLTAVERTGSKALAIWESLLNKFPFSADTMQKHHQLRQASELLKVRKDLLTKGKANKNIETVGLKIQDTVDSFISKTKLNKSSKLNEIRNVLLKKIGAEETFENLGINFKEAIKQESVQRFKRSQELFSKAGEAVPKDAGIPTENLTKVAQEQLKRFSKLKPSLKSKFSSLISILDDFSRGNIDKGLQKSLSELPPEIRDRALQEIQVTDKVNFDTLQLTRQILNDLIRGSDEAISLGQPGVKFLAKKGTAGGVFKQLKKALDADLLDFSNKTGGEIAERFQSALSFHGKTRQLFNSKIVKRILKSENPSNIVDMVVRPNNVTDIKLLKEIAGKENFSNIKKGFTNLIFDLKNDEAFNPQKIANMFRKYGDEVLSEVYSPKELQSLKKIITEGIDINKLPITDSFFKTIVRTKPEKVIDAIVRPDNTKNIIDIRKVVGKEGMEDIRAVFLEKILKLNKFERFSPAKFSTKVSEFGNKTLKELFKGKEGVLKDLLDLKEVSLLTGGAERIAGNPSGTAQTVISYSLAGSALLFDPITATQMVVLPKMLARLYLSKRGTKLLSEGVKIGANTEQGLAIAGRIMSILRKQKEEPKKESNLLLKQIGEIELPPTRKVSLSEVRAARQQQQ